MICLSRAKKIHKHFIVVNKTMLKFWNEMAWHFCGHIKHVIKRGYEKPEKYAQILLTIPILRFTTTVCLLGSLAA